MDRHLRRVVITGVGLVTPLGIGVERNWQRLMKGECAVRALKETDWKESQRKFIEAVTSRVVASVDRADLENCSWRPKLDSRRILPFIDYAETAAAEALLNSHLLKSDQIKRSRIGVSVGVGMSGSGEIASTWELMSSNSPRRISPFFISKILPNMAAGNISVRYGFEGPNMCSSTACAAGAYAIADAYHMIQSSQAEVMVAGGSESSVDAVAFLGFGKMKALSTSFNDSPEKASRPFDAARDGFVLGEGAGIVILEEKKNAVERNAPILAEMTGYGLSGDGFHITHPHPDGDGAYRAMSSAITHAKIQPKDISYINCHATSTPIGDTIELQAIERLFAGTLEKEKVVISSSKGAIGHLLGAAGAVEAIYTILSISKGHAPGTINLDNPERSLINLIQSPSIALEKGPRTIGLSNSFGFGGTNASLLFQSSA